MFHRKPTDCRRFAHEAPEGGRICHIDLGADAPDTSRQDGVAEKMAAMSEEQWNWVKSQYEAQAPDRAEASATARQVSQANLASMGLQNQIVADYKADRDTMYRPMEQAMVADAQAYDTTAKRDAAAAEGVADVGMQAEMARQAQTRNLHRMGVNPSSGKSLALQSQMGLGEAAAKAGAANTARDKVELQGYARKMDAVNVGRGNASAQATSAGIAQNAGAGAVSAGVTPVNVGQSGVGMVQQGLGTSLGGMSGAASIYGNSSQLKAQAGDNSGLMGALGSIGGGLAANPALFAASDKNQKTDRKEVNPEKSLSAIRKMPDSESWRYRDDSPAHDGGQTHVGPMAQDVRRSLGDQVAPGGKQIDLVSMNGHTLNAIKALDKKVDRAISLAQARKG